MANVEQIRSALAQGMGYEVTPQEVGEELSLLVHLIVDGWRQGYKVGFVDRWEFNRGTLDTMEATHVEVKPSAGGGSTATEAELETAAMAFLEKKMDQLTELTTDLVYVTVDASGRTAEVWFPMDELDEFEP